MVDQSSLEVKSLLRFVVNEPFTLMEITIQRILFMLRYLNIVISVLVICIVKDIKLHFMKRS